MSVAPLFSPASSGRSARVHSMSSSPPTSGALRVLVPAYLLVVGVGLLVAAVVMAIYAPDEWFVTLMSAAGGLTMLVTMALMLTVAKDR